ncbi:MAG: DUF2148 domain-containing protein [Geopsychrobacter sp.]|nr:DUF2148 domain-containing protein [Geopsychrobacter sp.]
MLQLDNEIETEGLLESARQICLAARTAPKGRGKDLLTTAVVSGDEKALIAERMREIGRRNELPFFLRDADNLDAVALLVLIGTRKEPLGLPHCGFCGFADCRALLDSGGFCSFNVGDLGISLGSAVSRAADMRIDNRIMYTVGKAVLELELLSREIKLVYGIPLSVTAKNPFFDRG